ncbi:hypothetical protein ALC53_05502 [Atta colombica]|uniref:Uncharacterized protein n=1 Tax=Atta colombica TaxID=520822 RepID=A0A195BIK8_9HYME|nr:hypothetical protein ALC53_05502 [Atta colombica]
MLGKDASAMKRMSTAFTIPDATLISVAAELLSDAKWKRGGKPEEKPAWSDVQQVGKPTVEARCCKFERAADIASTVTATKSPLARFKSSRTCGNCANVKCRPINPGHGAEILLYTALSMTCYFFNASYFLLFIIADGKWLISIIAGFIDVKTRHDRKADKNKAYAKKFLVFLTVPIQRKIARGAVCDRIENTTIARCAIYNPNICPEAMAMSRLYRNAENALCIVVQTKREGIMIAYCDFSGQLTNASMPLVNTRRASKPPFKHSRPTTRGMPAPLFA